MHVTSSQRENHPDDVDDSKHHQHSRLYDNKPRQSKLELGHLLSNMDLDSASALWDSLVDLVVKTVLVSQPHIYQSYQLCRVGKNASAGGRKRKELSVCFEILGFDVILDRNLRPFLLEVHCTKKHGPGNVEYCRLYVGLHYMLTITCSTSFFVFLWSFFVLIVVPL